MLERDEKNASSVEKPSNQIDVSLLRQIHHFPLVWQGEGAFCLENCQAQIQPKGWEEVEDPLTLLSNERGKVDGDAFQEFVYFHDFVRDFLYPESQSNRDRDSAQRESFTLYEMKDPGTVRFKFSGESPNIIDLEFRIERLTLHLFHTGVAMLTLETVYEHPLEPERGAKLTLFHVQKIIDEMRRSYTPYWDKNGIPTVVAQEVEFGGKTYPNRQKPDSMAEFLANSRATGADAERLEPWKTWLDALSQENWRDPSDERIPVMSFILLSQNGMDNRSVMQQVREQDWYRLAEADAGGNDYGYNPAFLAKKNDAFFYDRFMSETYNAEEDYLMPDYLATRHVFGGPHYCLVTVDDYFGRNVVVQHFRRHYEKMGMVVRFEFATLLGYSSRITKALELLNADGGEYRKEILRIHQDFLTFTHRFHFTGISSQIQAGEMFEKWRASVALDQLYQDVKEEITAASEYAQALNSEALSAKANKFAHIAIILSLIFAVPMFAEMFSWIYCAGTTDQAWGACIEWEAVEKMGLPLTMLVIIVVFFVSYFGLMAGSGENKLPKWLQRIWSKL